LKVKIAKTVLYLLGCLAFASVLSGAGIPYANATAFFEVFTVVYTITLIIGGLLWWSGAVIAERLS